MGKPIGITLGVVGAKTPLPPEAVIAHARPLQVVVTEPEAVESARGKRSKRTTRARDADGQFQADDPATPAVNEAWQAKEEVSAKPTEAPEAEPAAGPTIELSRPDAAAQS